MGVAIWCGRLTRKVHAIMTGSFSWSLLLVALLPLLIAPAYCQHTEYYRLTFILAIKTNDSGLEIYTFLVAACLHGVVTNISDAKNFW